MFDTSKGITPYWFVGRVENKNDPINAGRVKVRALGIHPEFPSNPASAKESLDYVETQDLPWAQCINGTYGKIHALPDEGEWVFGFFADGRDAQHPFILGTMYGTNTDIGSAPVVPFNVESETFTPRERYSVDIGRLYRSAEDLENDSEFQARLSQLLEKYPGLDKTQLYKIIDGESGFNPRARNASSLATGLFQFIPSTAAELGYSVDQIRGMSPAEQLDVYDAYLERWDYVGGDLGIIQAAPGLYGKPLDTEVYRRGTRAWDLNPGWRGPDGRITIRSINNYYNNR